MKKHLQKLNLTVLLSYALMVFLLLPFSAWAENWYGTKTFNNDEVINYDINLTQHVTIIIADGKTVTINGIISGPENCYLYLNKTASGTTGGTLIFNKKNTYEGLTALQKGVLELGVSGFIDKSSRVILENDTKLRISGSKAVKNLISGSSATEVIIKDLYSFLGIGTSETGENGGGIFTGKISGKGGLSKYGPLTLTLTGANTYEGNTEILQGTLKVNDDGSISSSKMVNIYAEGKLESSGKERNIRGLCSSYSTSEVILGSTLNVSFYDNTSDFAGKISGTGVLKIRTTLTLSGNNTYEGNTNIEGGCLKLESGGSIEKSSAVLFNSLGLQFLEIFGDKKINNLQGSNRDCLVKLNSHTLTVESTGVNPFNGKFTGTGSVIHKGTGTFAMNNQNEATGTFKIESGTVSFGNTVTNGGWAGDFEQNAGTKLVVNCSATIGKTLTLNGGEIDMNPTGTKPSKITVNGALSATGKTKLNITLDNEVTDYELIKATSGLDDLAKFSLNVPFGYSAKLTIKDNTLLLTASTTIDYSAPVPGNDGEITCTPSAESVTLLWEAAQDDLMPQNLLRYFVYRSNNNDIKTVTDCQANGKLLNGDGQVGINTFNDNGLTQNATYYYNVVVADNANNKAAYEQVKTTTTVGVASATLNNQIEVWPNPTTGELRIENGELRISNVEIFDVMGRKIPLQFIEGVDGVAGRGSKKGWTAKPDGVVIDLTVFPAGIYFLKITTKTGIVTKKIIKQ